MKKVFLNVLAVAAVITTAGFLLDGDVKEPSVVMRFTEYALMLGIVFTVLFAGVYGLKTFRRQIEVKS